MYIYPLPFLPLSLPLDYTHRDALFLFIYLSVHSFSVSLSLSLSYVCVSLCCLYVYIWSVRVHPSTTSGPEKSLLFGRVIDGARMILVLSVSLLDPWLNSFIQIVNAALIDTRTHTGAWFAPIAAARRQWRDAPDPRNSLDLRGERVIEKKKQTERDGERENRAETRE